MSFVTPTDDTTYIKALIYGSSGSGKTVFSGSFPKPAIIDCENGWKSIKAVHGYTPPVWSVKNKADLVDAYQFLASGEHDFETVIIDSLTDLNQYIVNDVMARNPTRRRDSKDLPAQLDWTESGRLMEKMVYLFRDLPMHVVFIAAERTFGGEGQDARVLPNVAPSLAEKLPHLVDVTLYASVVAGEDGAREYVGQTIPAKGRAAKDRSNALPTPYVKLGFNALAAAYGVPAYDVPTDPAPKAKKATKAKATPDPQVVAGMADVVDNDEQVSQFDAEAEAAARQTEVVA